MSILRSVAAFLVGAIFIFASTTAVIAYSFKDILQKENLTNFIRTNVTSGLIDEQCTDQCNQVVQGTPIDFNTCMQLCRNQAQNQTQNLDSYIDSVYNQQIYGTSLADITNLLNVYFLPLVALAVISGIALIFLSKNPFSTLGHNLISIGISFLIMGFIPNFLSLPTGATFEAVSSYFFAPFQNFTTYGIVAIVGGIALIVIGRLYMKKKIKKK